MGQKTHPTGFRIGVNKTHGSTWFANYGAYSEVLKEDYKIRAFFEKEFEKSLQAFGIEVEFIYQHDEYRNGRYNKSILEALYKRKEIYDNGVG